MAKTKEELLAMSIEDLAEYTLKQAEIKSDMTAEQTKLKEKITSLETSNKEFDTIKTELETFKAKETHSTLVSKLSGMNIQDKFTSDLITKSKVTVEMDEKEFNEAVAKTLETYPEYKKQLENAPAEEEKQETSKTYAELLREARGN